MNLVPLTLAAANDFVAAHHRHHRPVVGHRFSIGAQDGGVLVGAAIVGRPVARHLDDGFTAEVTRLVTDGTKNACSMLYAGLLAGMEGDGRASADHVHAGIGIGGKPPRSWLEGALPGLT